MSYLAAGITWGQSDMYLSQLPGWAVADEIQGIWDSSVLWCAFVGSEITVMTLIFYLAIFIHERVMSNELPF